MMILSSIKQIESIGWIRANNRQKVIVHAKINKRCGTKLSRLKVRFKKISIRLLKSCTGTRVLVTFSYFILSETKYRMKESWSIFCLPILR